MLASQQQTTTFILHTTSSIGGSMEGGYQSHYAHRQHMESSEHNFDSSFALILLTVKKA
jgi:hypothetical protein